MITLRDPYRKNKRMYPREGRQLSPEYILFHLYSYLICILICDIILYYELSGCSMHFLRAQSVLLQKSI